MATSTTPNTTTVTDDRPYEGPPVSDMIKDHTLASNIMKYHSHPTSSAILDESELSLLRRFVNNPKEREQILDEAKLTEQVPDIRGQYRGSLVGYVILRHRNEVVESVEPILTDEEIDELKLWFARGGANPQQGPS